MLEPAEGVEPPGIEVPPRPVERVPADPKGLRWITTGAGLALLAGVTGLAAPVALLLLGTYSPANLLRFGPTLVRATATLGIIGAILFAVSLLAFRTGFASFRTLEPRYWSAAILCLIGTVGYALLVVPTAVALTSSDALLECIRGAPTHTLSCLRTVAPLAGYTAIFAFWLVWLGQLGIVVGLVLTGRRFREPWLYAGTVFYGLLLLVFIAPFMGLVFSDSALAYAIFAAAALGLVAPAFVAHGGGQARGAHPSPSLPPELADPRSNASSLSP
ncbi:MAG: hypothetical protein L3K15_02405 [Thermoplasmata archaeon]|nr:hypothetical protein [Thermoplasmata archaeon]